MRDECGVCITRVVDSCERAADVGFVWTRMWFGIFGKKVPKEYLSRRRRYASPPVSVAAANEACARRALSRTASSRPPSIDASRNEATR